MPELPEVFAVAAAMTRLLTGDAMVSWQRLTPKLRREIPSAADVRPLIGRKLLAVKRYAKSLYLDFGLKICVHAHLGMTGYFQLADSAGDRLKHEHLRIEFAGGRVLSFCDPRRFGVIELGPLPEKTVVEPFAGELTSEYLAGACCESQRSIKSLIMDQKVIAGLGNIYATEGLLLAGVMPDRPAASLSNNEIRALTSSIIEVIGAAVSSCLRLQKSQKFTLDASTTHFPIVTHVYGRAGDLCGRCGKGRVACLRIAGRSSYYCPVCQK